MVVVKVLHNTEIDLFSTPVDKILTYSYDLIKIEPKNPNETWKNREVVEKVMVLDQSRVINSGYTTVSRGIHTDESQSAGVLITKYDTHFKVGWKIHDKMNDRMYVIKGYRRQMAPIQQVYWFTRVFLESVGE